MSNYTPSWKDRVSTARVPECCSWKPRPSKWEADWFLTCGSYESFATETPYEDASSLMMTSVLY